MKLFQIFYDDTTRQQVDPAFMPLDNTESERPDWFEYWPIRQALLNGSYDDDEYLGFFSPRFTEKTGLRGADVLERMSRARRDVVSFSPGLVPSVLFPNSFHQAESKHPGCLRATQAYLESVGRKIQLQNLVQDQTRIIFSNYFVARYRFWKQWLLLTEELFSFCEQPSNDLAVALNAPTQHRGQKSYPMKIFIMERMVSLALELQDMNAELGIDLHRGPLPFSPAVLQQVFILDALKGQFIKTGSPHYMGLYMRLRPDLHTAVRGLP